jgi:hypothetical protein
MNKTYEMKVNPEYNNININNNFKSQEFYNKYLDDKYLPQDFDQNLNVIYILI